MKYLLTTTAILAATAGLAQAQGLTAQSYASSIGTSDAMIAGAERFEAATGIDVTYNAIPSAGYNDAVNAAAAAGDLPDVLMIDGPNVANYVWAGYLRPLDDLVDPALLDDMTVAMKKQGTYGPDGKLYCVGPVDAGLAILGNRAYLEKAGVRIPTLEEPWTRVEFEEALAALAALDEVDAPLDMKLNYGVGEWMTYAFSPIVQSMGGDLIDRGTWQADGTINGPAAVAALQMVQGWQENGWIVPGTAGDAAFYGDKTAALSWIANWGVKSGQEGLGDDLLILPMPDFGEGPKTALGSWCWTITRDAENPEEAAALLEALLAPETIQGMYDAGVYPSGRVSALAERTPRYAEGGDLALYQTQLDTIAVERPVHPAYPIISSAFSQAFDDVLNGADPQEALDAAARKIDQDIEDNAGYPPFGG